MTSTAVVLYCFISFAMSRTGVLIATCTASSPSKTVVKSGHNILARSDSMYRAKWTGLLAHSRSTPSNASYSRRDDPNARSIFLSASYKHFVMSSNPKMSPSSLHTGFFCSELDLINDPAAQEKSLPGGEARARPSS